MIKKSIVFVLLSLITFSGLKAQEGLSFQSDREYNYFYTEGLREKLWGRYQTAFNYFNKCVQIRPESAPAYFELAMLYIQSGQVNEGITNLNLAVKFDPKNTWYQQFRVNFYRQTNDLQNAILSLEELVKMHPDRNEYRMELSNLYTVKMDYANAIKQYEYLLPHYDYSIDISYEIFRLYSLNEEWDKAEKLIKELIKKDKDNVKNYVLLGDLYLNTDAFKKANKYYKKAEKINADYHELLLSKVNYFDKKKETEAMLNTLHRIFRHPDISESNRQTVFLQIIQRSEKDPQIASAVDSLYSSYVSNKEDAAVNAIYGSFLVNVRKDSLGYNYYKKSLDLNPMNKELWVELLNVALTAQDMKGTDSVCTQGAIHFPKEPLFYFYSGLAKVNQKQLKEAIKVLKRGYAFIANNEQLAVQYNSFLGDVYHQTGNQDTAFIFYDEALKLNPDHLGTLNNYAYYLSLIDKDLDKAENMSARTVNLEPGNATYLDTYAWVLFKNAKYDLAKFYIERAITNGAGTNPEVMEHYADILLKSGDLEKAIEIYKQLIKLEYNVQRNESQLEQIR